MFFFKKRRSKKEAKKQLKQEQEQRELAEQQKVHQEEAKVHEKAEPKAKAEPVKPKEEVKPNAEVKPETSKEPAKTSTTAAKYHVSQNKDSKSEHFKKWRVRKEGSQKTIKFFDTQVEAIEYAEDLAEKAGSSIVIHKVDGSIRKQDYTKK